MGKILKFLLYYNTRGAHNYTPLELMFVDRRILPKEPNYSMISSVYNENSYYQEVRYGLQLANKRLLWLGNEDKFIYVEKAKECHLKVGKSVMINKEKNFRWKHSFWKSRNDVVLL